MRVFLSHNINTSQHRPVEYRDSEADLAALESLGKRLSDAGFRVFEYQFQRAETQTKDILLMMARQIALADAVVFVATRDAYLAPGWCVPELFHAIAHQKEVLCCRLRDCQFDGESLGDASNPNRFRILLPVSSPLHTPESLLAHLCAARERLAAGRAPSLFDHVDAFLAWRKSQSMVTGSIESLLDTYHSAWKGGFRPAPEYLRNLVSAPPGMSLLKLSGWIDDDHVGVVWSDHRGAFQITLLNARTGCIISTILPADVEVLGMGTSEAGELVCFSRCAAGLAFRCWHGDRWESLIAPMVPAVFTGVIRDRWFCGSDLFRLDWESQRLVMESPTSEDWAQFRRFTWFEPPRQHHGGATRDSIQPLLFATAPERWTLLPSCWRTLPGDARHNATRLVIWNESRVLFGDIGTADSFGTVLPDVRTTSNPPPNGSGKPPRYLGDLCRERRIAGPDPDVTLYRIETEQELLLSWTARHNRKQTRFVWAVSLAEARRILEEKILAGCLI